VAGFSRVRQIFEFYIEVVQFSLRSLCPCAVLRRKLSTQRHRERRDEDSDDWHETAKSGIAGATIEPAASCMRTATVSKKPTQSAGGEKPSQPIRNIAENRKAHHRFTVLESLECGIALVGSEVKSLRVGKLSLDEAYGRVKDGEVWLVGCDIQEYANASLWNHTPKRQRKLLMHRREVAKFAKRAKEKGLTLVPLKMYFNERGVAKVLLGLCRGKQLHDKREDLKKNTMKREMDRAVRRRG
jgi:SsrA-binding protein